MLCFPKAFPLMIFLLLFHFFYILSIILLQKRKLLKFQQIYLPILHPVLASNFPVTLLGLPMSMVNFLFVFS